MFVSDIFYSLTSIYCFIIYFNRWELCSYLDIFQITLNSRPPFPSHCFLGQLQAYLQVLKKILVNSKVPQMCLDWGQSFLPPWKMSKSKQKKMPQAIWIYILSLGLKLTVFLGYNSIDCVCVWNIFYPLPSRSLCLGVQFIRLCLCVRYILSPALLYARVINGL